MMFDRNSKTADSVKKVNSVFNTLKVI